MNKLKELRLKNNLKQTELAEILNITQGALSSWETGRYNIGNNDLMKIADFFHVSVDYLLGGVPNYTQTLSNPPLTKENKKIPIINSVKYGINGLVYDYLNNYVFIDSKIDGEIIAFKCKGDRMSGLGIFDNDIAIIRKQDSINDGELAIVIIKGGEGLLQKVRFYKNVMILESANQKYASKIFLDEERNIVKIIGKVLEIRKLF